MERADRREVRSRAPRGAIGVFQATPRRSHEIVVASVLNGQKHRPSPLGRLRVLEELELRHAHSLDKSGQLPDSGGGKDDDESGLD